MNTFVGVRESPSVIAPSLLKNLPIGAISLAAPTPGSSWAQTKLPSFACGGRSGAKSRFRRISPRVTIATTNLWRFEARRSGSSRVRILQRRGFLVRQSAAR